MSTSNPRRGDAISIVGLQEAQQRNLNRSAAMYKPDGVVQRELQSVTIAAHRYAVSITHVGRYRSNGKWAGGGTLRASHRIKMDRMRGIIFIDPSARNPRSKTPPVEYGVYENARGGTHAFYDRTMTEAVPNLLQVAKENITRSLVNGE